MAKLEAKCARVRFNQMRQCTFTFRDLAVVTGTLLLGSLGTACRRESSKPRVETIAPSSLPNATPLPSQNRVVAQPLEPDIEALLVRWNAATNTADAPTLEKLYAPNLSLYGRIVTGAEGVRLKVNARKQAKLFQQSTEDAVAKSRNNGDILISIKKNTHHLSGVLSVPAYLLVRRASGELRIVDEGDRVTDHSLAVKRDTLRANWGERFFQCPDCVADGDDIPNAFPPLGPSPLTPGASVPPGAPSSVEFGRLMLPRFASAVDVPLFLTVTPQSTNGDGRWEYFAAPTASGTDIKKLFECTTGGFWIYDRPESAPDPGHVSYPEITFVEKVTRDAEGVHYEKRVFSPERIENFVRCDISADYEAYFIALAKRMGRSLRVTSGGMYNRPERASDPY